MIEKLPDSGTDPVVKKINEVIGVVNEITEEMAAKAALERNHMVSGFLKMLCVRPQSVKDFVDAAPEKQQLLEIMLEVGAVIVDKENIIRVTPRARAELGMGEWPTPEEMSREEELEADLLVRFVNGGAMRREDMTETDHEMALRLANQGLVDSDGAEMWISDRGKRFLASLGRETKS